jgi:hypothetical protein
MQLLLPGMELLYIANTVGLKLTLNINQGIIKVLLFQIKVNNLHVTNPTKSWFTGGPSR